MVAKKVDPMLMREQMAAALRKSKKKELLSKKRNQHGLFQEQEPGFPEHEYREEQMYLEQEYYELPQRGPEPDQEGDAEYDYQQPAALDTSYFLDDYI